MQHRSTNSYSACTISSINNKNILLHQTSISTFSPSNHLELDLVTTIWEDKAGERKSSRSKIKLRIKKKEEELTRKNNEGRFMKIKWYQKDQITCPSFHETERKQKNNGDTVDSIWTQAKYLIYWLMKPYMKNKLHVNCIQSTVLQIKTRLTKYEQKAVNALK